MERQLALATSDQQRRQWSDQFATASYNLGLALVSSGDAAEAAEHFRRAVQIQPNHVESLVNLGALLARGGQTEQALEYLERAVGVDSSSLPARMNLAAALGSLGRFADAAEQYQIVITAQAENARAHAQLGRSFLELGKLELAQAALRRAVELNPKDFAASLSLAWLLATSTHDTQRQADEAVQLAERLKLSTSGRNPLVLDVLAAAYAEQGEFAKASATLDEAIQLVGRRNEALARLLRTRQEQYATQRPHRDPDGKYP
jgi:tetratricopeptide (TPR) repeat protein